MRCLLLILLLLNVCLIPVVSFAAGDSVSSVRTPVYGSYGFTGVGAQLGAESVYINPSILASVSQNIFEACYGSYYSVFTSTTLMLTRSGEFLGGSFSGFYSNNIINGLAQTDDNNYDNKPDVIGKMDYFGQTFLVSYYNTYESFFNYSVGLRYIEQGISGINNSDHPWYRENEKGIGYGCNIGFSSLPLIISGGVLQVGLSLYDFGGTSLRWASSRETISQSYKLGLSWQQIVSEYMYRVLLDMGENGLSCGVGLNLVGTGLSFAAGAQSGINTVGVSCDLDGLVVSLAYLNHIELGGSYSLAVSFPIIPDAEKLTSKRIEKEFSTIKGSPAPVESGIELITTSNIDTEIEQIKNQNSDFFSNKDNQDYTIEFIPESLQHSQRAFIKVQTGFSDVKSVILRIGIKKVVLSEDVVENSDIPEKFKSLIRDAVPKSFSGKLLLPEKPGKYNIDIIIENNEGSKVYTEVIQVK